MTHPQPVEAEAVAWRSANYTTDAWSYSPYQPRATFYRRREPLFPLSSLTSRDERIAELEGRPEPKLSAVLRRAEAKAFKAEALLEEAVGAFNYVCGLLPGGVGAIDREADTYVLNCMVNVGELRRVRSLRQTLSTIRACNEGEG